MQEPARQPQVSCGVPVCAATSQLFLLYHTGTHTLLWTSSMEVAPQLDPGHAPACCPGTSSSANRQTRALLRWCAGWPAASQRTWPRWQRSESPSRCCSATPSTHCQRKALCSPSSKQFWQQSRQRCAYAATDSLTASPQPLPEACWHPHTCLICSVRYRYATPAGSCTTN